MRAILIDPYYRSISETDIGPEHYDSLVRGVAERHWIVPHCLQRHIGYVDIWGLTKGQALWFFREVHIWGPLVVVGASDTEATCSRQAVERLTRFRTR